MREHLSDDDDDDDNDDYDNDLIGCIYLHTQISELGIQSDETESIALPLVRCEHFARAQSS